MKTCLCKENFSNIFSGHSEDSVQPHLLLAPLHQELVRIKQKEDGKESNYLAAHL